MFLTASIHNIINTKKLTAAIQSQVQCRAIFAHDFLFSIIIFSHPIAICIRNLNINYKLINNNK